MSISIDRYVSITSGVIGAQAVAQRELVGMRFTTDLKVPVDAVITVDSDGAIDYFGASAPETVFANQYFSYVSPAPASRAARLRFGAWANVDRAARVFGAGTSTLIGDLTVISTGSINLTLGDYQTTVSAIDLTEDVTFADVAATIQAAIRAVTAGGAAWTTATVTFDALAGAFNLVAGTAGDAAVSVASSITGTDLSQLIGWRNTGTIYSPGLDAESPLEAFRRVEQITDSFGSASFGASITEAQAVALAQYIAAQNVKYQFYVPVTADNEASFYAALKDIQSTGLILNGTAGQYKESIPAAIMAATNYDRRNATVNYMYRQVGGMTADVTTDAVADDYDTKRISYYGETSSAGQKLAFFQRGFLQGTATSPVDMNVHANEQWLKAYLTARLLSLQLSLGKIPANNEGRGIVLAQVVDGVNLGKFNGTISVGKNLTTAQQIAVTQLTGDPEAWRDVQINGYWADVAIVEQTGPSGATEYVAQYTLAYAKNDVVRRIEGSHNLI